MASSCFRPIFAPCPTIFKQALISPGEACGDQVTAVALEAARVTQLLPTSFGQLSHHASELFAG
jgi:hypothetical protein